ncbi:UDP-N-acetylmuramoyl-L-alanyl-D-glutamate--2,6-diaminopimelate ligase [Clostridium sp. DL1XJH146]
MELKKVLNKVKYSILNGDINKEIEKIQYDSRKVGNGDVFFCVEGYKVDGHDFAQKAIEKGASVIICSKKIKTGDNLQITILQVEDVRKALAISAANYFDNPSHKIKLIGITGTNGKTTSSFMLKSVLKAAKKKTGLIGTINNYILDEKISTERTTPESLELQELFSKMVCKDVEYCIMEVSSHSLSLDRVYNVDFDYSLYTNLTRDHLDFHNTFEEYYKAKLKLFKNGKNNIVNIDDEYGKRIIEDTNSSSITYSILVNDADVVASGIITHSRGVQFDLNYKGLKEQIHLNIPGRYNVYNALCAAAVCLRENIDVKIIKKGLENAFVPGRCELVSNKYNLNFDIIIDYAHTPDGLENILKTAQEFTKGRLISVFGCGGDRDKTKRPIMGKIGSELSDVAIITSDNPRTEDPEEIIKDIMDGIEKDNDDNLIVVVNRKDAIKKAIQIAEENDVIVIAGKGHEDYQILKNEVIHFDEREVIDEIIREVF